MKRTLSAIAALTCALHAPALAQASQTLLENASVIDVESGNVTRGQNVLVEDGKIAAIGSRVRANEDAERIDLGGAFLLPGLTDSHVHLTSRADRHGLRRLIVSTPRAAISGVANSKITLEAGFTTVRNLGAPGYADIDLRKAIDEGEIIGPRIVGAGQAISITGGHCGDATSLPFEDQVKGRAADGPWAARQKVRENKKYGADVIKFCATGGVLSPNTTINAQQFTLEEMKAITDEAKALDLKVAVHAHGPRGIQSALDAGVDSIEHASMITDASLAQAVAQGTYLSMDVYVSDYILSEGEAAGILEEWLAKERQVGRFQRERFKAAVEAGANIAFGTDAGVYPHGTNARQFAKMVEWGMTPLQAIQASTIGNADLFGMSDEIGTITVGKFADLIAVPENPLSDVSVLEHVDFVMKGGAVYKNELDD
nr:amidohydrolase family protein [Hyphomonas sp. Mor2]